MRCRRCSHLRGDHAAQTGRCWYRRLTGGQCECTAFAEVA